MDIKNFIQGISFSGLKPTDPGIALMCGSAQNCICTRADLAITHFAENEALIKERLSDICAIPRMSTIAIGAIINQLVGTLRGDECFVNVGVWNGFSFLCGLTANPGRKCIGIDNFSQFGGPRHEFMQRFNKYKSPNHLFFDMDYQEYFKTHAGDIGFYIYDGNHAREHQYQGLTVAEPFFSDNCYILIDDINSAGPMEGTEEFLKKSRFRYNMIFCQETSHNMHPTYWNGLLVLQKDRLKSITD